MPQTFLALGALVLMALVGFQHQQARVHEQRRATRTHIVAAARSVGAEIFERLDTLPFDAVATSDANALTREDEFGLEGAEDPLAEASDIDDVHGVWDQPVPRILSDPSTGGQRTLTFAVEARVAYVTVQGGAVTRTGGARSFAKEVSLIVDSEHLIAPLHLQRVYTP